LSPTSALSPFSARPLLPASRDVLKSCTSSMPGHEPDRRGHGPKRGDRRARGDHRGSPANACDTQQADVYNLLGFTLRKTGDFKTSLTYYTKALELQPDHKAAREYLGELYVETGNIAKAKEQLAILAKLCPSGCEEREEGFIPAGEPPHGASTEAPAGRFHHRRDGGNARQGARLRGRREPVSADGGPRA
jgi:hypothetical protein